MNATAIRRRFRVRTRWIVCAAIAVLVAVPAVLILQPSTKAGPEPADLVALYLDAIRAGDVDGALNLARQHPGGEAARFLVADALSADWTVNGVRETTRGDGDARVEAALTGPEGEAVGTFDVHKGPDGTWGMTDPFVTVAFPPSPFEYVDIGGVHLVTQPDTQARSYLLLPGSYVAYPHGSPMLDNGSVAWFALPGSAPDSSLDMSTVMLNANGTVSANAAVKAYIDTCAERTGLESGYCPFAGGSDLGALVGYPYMRDYKDVTWTVETYPELTFTFAGSAFAVQESTPGRVALSTTGADRRWTGKDFVPADDHHIELTCGIKTDALRLTLAEDGSWHVRNATDPGAKPEALTYSPGTAVDTCAI